MLSAKQRGKQCAAAANDDDATQATTQDSRRRAGVSRQSQPSAHQHQVAASQAAAAQPPLWLELPLPPQRARRPAARTARVHAPPVTSYSARIARSGMSAFTGRSIAQATLTEQNVSDAIAVPIRWKAGPFDGCVIAIIACES